MREILDVSGCFRENLQSGYPWPVQWADGLCIGATSRRDSPPRQAGAFPGSGRGGEKRCDTETLRRDEFLGHYHLRSNAESTFSMVKAKFRDHVRSKTDPAMKNEHLAKFLCYNI
jgi:hypothetical protein